MEQQKTIMTLEDLIKLSDEKYLELLNNKETKTLLKTIGLFSNQTISNDVLILTQNPNATITDAMLRKMKKQLKLFLIISTIMMLILLTKKEMCTQTALRN